MVNRFTLKLNRKTIYESSKIKYLGMLLDKSLSWKYHIAELRIKLSRATGILYKMKKSSCSKSVLMSLYYSLFHSHLSYGICLYGMADEKYTSNIALIQKRAIRIVSNASFTAHTRPLFSELKILSFDKVLNLQLSILMWEFDHGNLPVIFNDYFQLAKNIHNHNTRFASKNKLSENILVNTDMHGKKMLRFLGPRIFNHILELEFYERCKAKSQFKSRMKDYLLTT